MLLITNIERACELQCFADNILFIYESFLAVDKQLKLFLILTQLKKDQIKLLKLKAIDPQKCTE